MGYIHYLIFSLVITIIYSLKNIYFHDFSIAVYIEIKRYFFITFHYILVVDIHAD